MGKTHNKKRNVGIIYEQLLRLIAKHLVEGNNGKHRKGLAILKRNFKPGSELYREFRLFNALVKTTVPSDSLAARILAEAKLAALDFDAQQLRKEKAQLIKEINHGLNYPDFYQQKVADYRSYATIQTLLNDWRLGSRADLMRIAKYESQVCQWLLTEKKDVSPLSEQQDVNINHLTVKLMTEKFNKKYSGILNYEQSNLIKEYVFSMNSGNEHDFIRELETLKDEAISELSLFVSQSKNKILQEKFELVRKNINEIDTKNINDEMISRFLVVSKLKSELLEKVHA
jgi:hypothetical protein